MSRDLAETEALEDATQFAIGERELSDPVNFTKPGPRTDREALREALAIEREDDPPPDVPRDQWDRPLIVDLDGAGVSPYVRASKYGKIIEDEYTLTWWKLRSVAYGMSRGHHLVVKAQSVQSQSGSHNIAALKDVCERALILAGADAGAITGTGLHALSQRADAGDDLSWLDPLTLACLEAYRVLFAPFEVLASEGFVVHDELKGAGSYDRIIRLPFDLVWPDGVVIPAGTVVVVDVKTGKVSSMKYWGPDFTCQQLIYDEGIPYFPGVTILEDPHKRSIKNVLDVVDQPGTYGRVGWEAIGVPQAPDPRWSLILHVPAAAPWDAHWERVDLDVAREDAAAARLAWERHRVSRATRFLALPASALPGPGVVVALSGGVGSDAGQPVTPNETCPVHGEHPGRITCPGCIEGHQAATAVGQQAAALATYVDDPVDSEVSTGDETKINSQLVAILHERIIRCDKIELIEQLYDSWHKSPSWLPEHDDRCQELFDRLSPPEDVTRCDGCNYDTHRCPACGIGVPHGKDCCRSCELRLLLTDAPDTATIDVLWEAHKPADEGGDGLWDAGGTGEHTEAARVRWDELEASTGGFCASCITGGEDPLSWCDCQPDETCMDDERACRRRAHDPSNCLHRPGDAQPEPPGPFDDTLTLADLRTKLTEALDTDTVDALYDAYGPDAGGPWDDECNTLAQAAYDRLSAVAVPS